MTPAERRLLRATADRLDDVANVVTDPLHLFEDAAGRQTAASDATCGCVVGNLFLAARDTGVSLCDDITEAAEAFLNRVFSPWAGRTDEALSHHGPTMALKYQGHAFCANRIYAALDALEARR